MFRLDKTELTEFSLPQRTTPSTMLPQAPKKDKTKPSTGSGPRDKDKAADATKEPVTLAPAAPVEENEFSFLPGTMGRVDPNAGLSGKKNDTQHAIEKTAHADDGEEDEVAVIMAGIQTSDDAINFFARFGSETPVKFIHLVQDRNPKIFSPYDLVAAKEKDTQGEHYTMSPAGIVHVCPGEPSECTPLSAWMRQGMMFKILRNIPFYKFFLHRKMFTVWRENVRFLFFAKQRRKLSDRLFYARRTASESILSVKRHLIDIQNVRLLNLDLKTHNKEEFMAMQSDTGVAANAKFEEVITYVTREVERVIDEVTVNYSASKQDPNAHAMGYDNGAEKAKSLVKIKQEKAEKKILRARAKLEHTTLAEFIRFVDYMVVETLVGLAVNTTSAFHDELLKPRKSGVFETMVRFSSSGTAFAPTCLEIRDMLDRLLENMINFVGGVNRVRHLGNNKNTTVSGPNIQGTIRENKQFRRISDQIQQRVIGDYDKAEEHSQAYESVRPIFDFNETWDYAAYCSQSHDIASLKGMLELIGNWGKELEKLRNKPIGVLEVDSKRLKGELNPLKEARLQEIKEYIKDEARLVWLQNVCVLFIFVFE
jgi:dynein heavy chain, axonemal